jgi:hypothetical protein
VLRRVGVVSVSMDNLCLAFSLHSRGLAQRSSRDVKSRPQHFALNVERLQKPPYT